VPFSIALPSSVTPVLSRLQTKTLAHTRELRRIATQMLRLAFRSLIPPPMAESKLFDDELNQAMQQLFDETIEAIQLSKVSPDLDDLAATFAVALLKLGLATGFVEQKHPGFAKDVEEKRQRVIAALTQKH
jgi:hypothetical protein